jgi:hypothetical protein
LIASLVFSTIAFFIAAWYLRRWLDYCDIPTGLTRSLVIFIGASAVSWGVAVAVDWLAG